MPNEQVAPVPLKKFLEDTAPGQHADVTELIGPPQTNSNGALFAYFSAPEISLYCPNQSCAGPRFFRTGDKPVLYIDQTKLQYITYSCKNCEQETKVFALWLLPSEDRSGKTFKFGEFPAFGPPTPARLISLIGSGRELFLKGRRAENQGLGIAAFAYYRRVIEGQKDRIFDEVISVCKRLKVDQDIVEDLIAGKGETQFAKAVSDLKHGIPQVLFINGQNPLTLLHGALSEGLHAESDEDCLEWATVIRVVMTAFAERMAQALKDEAELNTAVSRLVQKKVKALPSLSS